MTRGPFSQNDNNVVIFSSLTIKKNRKIYSTVVDIKKQCHRCNTLADDVGVIGGVSSLVGDSLASGRRCS